MTLQEGVKYDQGKVDWTHMPWDAMEDVMRVYMMGAEKYARGNYLKGILYSRIFRAGIEHARKWWQQKDLDEESGLNHLAHAVWNFLTLLEFEKRGGYKDFDNRYLSERPIQTPPIIPPRERDPIEEDGEDEMVDVSLPHLDGGFRVPKKFHDALQQALEATSAMIGEQITIPMCPHDFQWVSQYSDTIGVHITVKCTRCGEVHKTTYGLPEQTGTVSIPSIWVPNGLGGIVEGQITTSVPPGARGVWLNLNTGHLEDTARDEDAPPEGTAR